MQTRRDSFLESVFNTLIGFCVNYFAGFLIIPLVFGFAVTAGENFKVTFIYTLLSILRGYGLRRFFNWYHGRKGGWK